MTVFHEEVISLFDLKSGTEPGERMLSRTLTVRRSDPSFVYEFKQTFLGTPPSLDLFRFWHENKDSLLAFPTESTKEGRIAVWRRQKVILILYGGIFLFTTPDYKLAQNHAMILVKMVFLQDRGFAQSVLAFLMAGLSSAAMCGPFFGSPWLLQTWLMVHFPTIGKIRPGGPGMTIHPWSPSEWLAYFHALTDGDVIFPPFHCPAVVVAKGIAALRVIGALHFPLYQAHRCCRMLQLPPLVVQPVSCHDMLAPFSQDERVLSELVESWTADSTTVPITDITMDVPQLEDYLLQMKSLIPHSGPALAKPAEPSKKRHRSKKQR